MGPVIRFVRERGLFIKFSVVDINLYVREGILENYELQRMEKKLEVYYPLHHFPHDILVDEA
jgi:hypothetical protein